MLNSLSHQSFNYFNYFNKSNKLINPLTTNKSSLSLEDIIPIYVESINLFEGTPIKQYYSQYE